MQPMNSKGGCKEWYFKVLWKKIHSTQYIVVAEYSWIWSNLVLRVARLDLELVVTICLPVCCSFSKPTEAFCSFCWSRVLHFFCWEFFPFLIFFFFLNISDLKWIKWGGKILLEKWHIQLVYVINLQTEIKIQVSL